MRSLIIRIYINVSVGLAVQFGLTFWMHKGHRSFIEGLSSFKGIGRYF